MFLIHLTHLFLKQNTVDVDECTRSLLSGTKLCSQTQQCVNLPGRYECRCPPGTAVVNAQGDCEQTTQPPSAHIDEVIVSSLAVVTTFATLLLLTLVTITAVCCFKRRARFPSKIQVS